MIFSYICVILLLLKINGEWEKFWILREIITSWACLLEPGLKFIFHWNAQLFLLLKSPFKFFADKSLSLTTVKGDMPSENNLGFETKLLDKSFIYIYIYIYIYRSLKIEPLGTPSSAVAHVKCWPFRATLCYLPLKKFVTVFKWLPATLFCFNL